MNLLAMVRGVFQDQHNATVIHFVHFVTSKFLLQFINDYFLSFEIGVHECRDLTDELNCPSSTQSPPSQRMYPYFFLNTF